MAFILIRFSFLSEEMVSFRALFAASGAAFLFCGVENLFLCFQYCVSKTSVCGLGLECVVSVSLFSLLDVQHVLSCSSVSYAIMQLSTMLFTFRFNCF